MAAVSGCQNIVTIELHEIDAFRLLYLVQKEAAEGKIWDRYWETLANHIRENIVVDLEHLAQIEYQEALARNGGVTLLAQTLHG